MSRFIRALQRQPVDCTPVWLMRQAGRYLPEYRALRAQAGSFMSLCRNPQLAAEVTLQPLERFDLDAAIIFSDILTIPDAMGLGLYFVDQEGPCFERPTQTAASIEALPVLAEDGVPYVAEAIKLTKQQLQGRAPLIGFCGSPWTVATYMVEGKGRSSFVTIKKMMFQEPALLQQLLKKVTQSSIAYLKSQIAAGADAVMIFDSWGGVLSHQDYQHFSLAWMKEMVSALKQYNANIPVILFTKGGGLWLESMADSGCAALGLDWTVPLADAHARVGHRVALQGNLDPLTLLAGPEVTAERVRGILAECPASMAHVFNLGHGLVPETPIESVQALIETVHSVSKKQGV